jgi:hypothetical protein
MHLAQAMTALQNKNTMGAIMQLKLLNQSLTTLSTGAGGVATSGGIPGPVPVEGPDQSGDSSGSGPSGGHGAGSSGAGISGGGGPGAGSSAGGY